MVAWWASIAGGLLLLSSPAPGPGVALRLAVLEIPGDGDDVAYRKLLAETARKGALEALRGSPYRLMSREEVAAVLETTGECSGDSGDCVLDAGRTVQADTVLAGELLLVSGKHVLTMKLVDVKTGEVQAVDQLAGTGAEDLLGQVENAAFSLARRLVIGKSGAFGHGSDVRIPVIQPPRRDASGRPTGLGDINIHAEESFQRAMEVQATRGATAEDKVRAWCFLAGIPENNPYLQTAADACDGWRRYLAERSLLQQTVAGDYETLGRYVKLKTRTPSEKLLALDDFLATYGPLTTEWRVDGAREFRKNLADGKTAELPEQSPEDLRVVTWRPRLLQAAGGGLLGLGAGALVLAVLAGLPVLGALALGGGDALLVKATGTRERDHYISVPMALVSWLGAGLALWVGSAALTSAVGLAAGGGTVVASSWILWFADWRVRLLRTAGVVLAVAGVAALPVVLAAGLPVAGALLLGAGDALLVKATGTTERDHYTSVPLTLAAWSGAGLGSAVAVTALVLGAGLVITGAAVGASSWVQQ